MDRLTPRVLVVDDEDAIRDLLEYGLSSAGFTVRSAANGRAALEAVDEWAPEAIVLDVMLPQIDGYALRLETRHVVRYADLTLDLSRRIAMAFRSRPVPPPARPNLASLKRSTRTSPLGGVLLC